MLISHYDDGEVARGAIYSNSFMNIGGKCHLVEVGLSTASVAHGF